MHKISTQARTVGPQPRPDAAKMTLHRLGCFCSSIPDFLPSSVRLLVSVVNR